MIGFLTFFFTCFALKSTQTFKHIEITDEKAHTIYSALAMKLNNVGKFQVSAGLEEMG